MKQKFENKNVLVIGLGISGLGAAKLLHALGANVIVNEQNTLPEDSTERQILETLGISYIGGGHDIAILHDIDYVVKNPGIPYYTPFIQAIVEKGIPILTEPEIAMQACKGKVIALTGTNGKTTTTMLIYAMLKNHFDEVYVAGNIGVSFAEIAMEASSDAYIVLELSSFQLMGMPDFAPDCAIILNLDEAHLDYHTDINEYHEAKYNIFKNIGDNTIILNDDDRLLHAKALKLKDKHVELFSVVSDDVTTYVDENADIYYKGEQICHLGEITVPGAHNIQNVLAAITAVKKFNVSTQAIVTALRKFQGVEHRLEYVRTLNNRKIFNDSKSTNIKAAQVALSAFQEPIVWIAGGLDRGNELDEIIPYCEKVKVIIAYGEAKQKFIDLAETMKISSFSAESLQEAVTAAYDFSDENDIILLSPACASWDQFKNFEQRGTLFKECVHALK